MVYWYGDLNGNQIYTQNFLKAGGITILGAAGITTLAPKDHNHHKPTHVTALGYRFIY